MRCEDILRVLNEDFPAEYAQSWDNVGLLVGDREKEVTRVLVALDASDAAVARAEELGAELLLTHHPLIFSPLKKITADDFLGRRLLRMIRQDLAYAAMHTNYDVARMAAAAADRLCLGAQRVLAKISADGEAGFGRVGELEEPVSLERFARQVKEVFGLPGVRVYGNPASAVSRAAVCPGSGKSFFEEVRASGAQAYVTGDVDYHFAIDAVSQGVAVIDAGHYGVEHIFLEDMKAYLTERFGGALLAEALEAEHPYTAL